MGKRLRVELDDDLFPFDMHSSSEQLNKTEDFGEPENIVSHLEPVKPTFSVPSTCTAQGCKNRKKKSASQVEPGSRYCKKHKCGKSDCPKIAVGPLKICISHGGGPRCSYSGCVKGAQGATRLCIFHGGGRRCQDTQCASSAVGGSDLCTRHTLVRNSTLTSET